MEINVNKLILVLCFLVFGCGGGSSEAVTHNPDAHIFLPAGYTPVGFKIGDLMPVSLASAVFNDSSYFNGQIDHINLNSWVFTSHTNPLCIDVLVSHCRKVNAVMVEGQSVPGRVTRIKFELNVVELNKTDAPYWVIIYQDWVKVDPLDGNGNHPITTVKLKVFNGNLNICHYDNSWQWGFDFGDNVDGDKIDVNHDLHQENTKGGCAAINIGVNHDIEIWNYDDGFFQLYVDEDLISHKAYQTKSPTESHVMQWALYWNKGYNKEHDPLKRIVIRIDDFAVTSTDL